MAATDDLSKRLPKKIRTEEELREMKRFDMRQIATEHFGMDPKVCSKLATNEVMKFILEKQEELRGEKSGTKGNGKAATSAKASTKKREPEPEPEAEDEVEAEEAEGGSLNALGLALDSHAEESKEVLRDVQRQVFTIFGLVASLYVQNEGQDGLEERLKELEEEWEKLGN